MILMDMVEDDQTLRLRGCFHTVWGKAPKFGADKDFVTLDHRRRQSLSLSLSRGIRTRKNPPR